MFLLLALVLYLGIQVYKSYDVIMEQKEFNKECAYIGGITVGTDSVKAVDHIRRRLSSIGHDADKVTFGDSIGYYIPSRNESYYITLDDDHKVNGVYFHSDSLTDKEVAVIARGNRYSRHKTLYHKGDRWIAFQDGNGTFIIRKVK